MIQSLLKTGKIPFGGIFLYLLFSALAFGAVGQTYPIGSEPTVVSDKDDYAPGEVAVISGSGWTLGYPGEDPY